MNIHIALILPPLCFYINIQQLQTSIKVHQHTNI